jgi:hypothetical protein
MRLSIGTGLVLMAAGGVLAFAVNAPPEVTQYVDVVDLGLILVWTGVLVLLTQVWLHRPPRPRQRYHTHGRDRYGHDKYGYDGYDDETRDVHRPGYAGETQRLPTVRGGGRRR